LIEDNADNFPFSLDASVTISGITSTVRDILLEKHPSPQLPCKAFSLSVPSDFSSPPFHPSYLDGTLIRHTILHMDGAAEASGLDIASWKKLCTAFQEASDILCDSISAVARRLAVFLVNSANLSAFTACHLIGLDKHPGVLELRRSVVGFFLRWFYV